MTEQPPVDDAQSERWEAAEEGMELLHAGEAARAIDELLRVAHEDPENEYALHFLGHAYFQKEAFPEALKSYVEALRLAPDYVGAMIGAGQTLGVPSGAQVGCSNADALGQSVGERVMDRADDLSVA